MSDSFPDPRRWWALVVLATAQFMVIMDTSIIGVALPEIQRSVGFSQSNLSWVFNAYVIAFGGLLLLGGRLSDLFGARRMFMLGFAILSAASLLTGLARSEEVLLAGRALQGLGSALIAPGALTRDGQPGDGCSDRNRTHPRRRGNHLDADGDQRRSAGH